MIANTIGESTFLTLAELYTLRDQHEEVHRLIKRDYGGARATGPGPETLPPRDDYILRGHSVNGLVETAATLKAQIDTAVAAGAWMILTFHKLVPGPQPPKSSSKSANSKKWSIASACCRKKATASRC